MIEQTSFGVWIIAEDTHISKWVQEHGRLDCDVALFDLMRGWLKGVNTVWDVGANIGDHTRFYLNEGFGVVAIEPNPEAFECLSRNCPEARCLNLAASSSEGELSFAPAPNVGASRISASGEIKVRAARLDDLSLPEPDFVKIDVEGWELEALKGMRKTLEERLPMLFIEINSGALAANSTSKEEIRKFLRDVGYSSMQRHPSYCLSTDPQYDWLVRK
jgi:FkbM family methyltransferase